LASLTSKIYNVKTSLFEQTNELSAMKITYEHLVTSIEKADSKLTDASGAVTMGMKNMEEMKSGIPSPILIS